MKIELEQVSPHEIEKRSFEIITEELNGKNVSRGSGTGCKAVYPHKCGF